MSYKLVTGRKGVRYMKDGKFIAKDKVPQVIQDELKVGEVLPEPVAEIVEIPPANQQISKSCIFCGAYSNWNRIVNLQTVALCQDHYYSETIGKVAQKLREKELTSV